MLAETFSIKYIDPKTSSHEIVQDFEPMLRLLDFYAAMDTFYGDATL